MRVKSDLGYTKAIAELNARLAKVDHKLMLLLFENTPHDIKLTESELEAVLEDGDGIYWDYEDEKMSPYSSDVVVDNLINLEISELDTDNDDFMYDFNERL